MGKLSDKAVQAAKPVDKDIKLFDGDGLFLLVRASGNKLWRMKYRFEGKEKLLSFGQYPEVTLKEAREKTFEARVKIHNGIDPMAEKKAEKEARIEAEVEEANNFEAIAREWFEKFSKSNGWAENHSSKILGRLEKDVLPWIGKRPIRDITAPELLAVMRRIEARGALETAHRALSECGRIFRYAVASGLAERDPSGDLKGALPPYRKDKHFAAVTDPKLVGDLLRDIDGYFGKTIVVRSAFALAPRLFLRPGELRKMQWDWIDFEDAMLTIPPTGHKMGKKTQAPHLVPLSTQSIEILREIEPLTGKDKYVFPGARDKNRPMSDNAIRSAMRRLGWTGDEMTPHGFRAMASTILDNMGYRQEWLERQLAHEEQNKVKAAYKREQHKMYLPERRKMMQEWSDYLDSLKTGAEVIPFRKPA
jgi:integrase